MTTSGVYRKRPVLVMAVQFNGENVAEMRESMPTMEFVTRNDGAFSSRRADVLAQMWDPVHSTWVDVKEGDWIVRGIRGEHRLCKNGIFITTYELAFPW